ncbi:hypothetical protein [Brasilonema bromeliae]|uniref:hypothetical protein n=1 Tax=Brasilonema bromeliae TaxID=383615 RepID=UPI00145D867D|nr:hypothetical protein [Brasilonema bromeliae]
MRTTDFLPFVQYGNLDVRPPAEVPSDLPLCCSKAIATALTMSCYLRDTGL